MSANGVIPNFTLVAIDWDGSADQSRLLSNLAHAGISRKESSMNHWKTGVAMQVHTLVLNGSLIRNTTAHYLACKSGFVAHVEAAA